MSMMEIHESALGEACAAYHEFLLMYKAERLQVYGIVEGKGDPQFYRGFIEGHLPDGWTVELMPADGKRNVINSYHQFDWSRFPRSRICFFVDRDLSEFVAETIPADTNVYVTDGYSIENDVVNFGAFRRFIEEVLNISRLSPEEISILEESFVDSMADFKDAMASIMGQIIVWRREGRRPCLGDFSPIEMFSLVGSKLSLKPEFESSSSKIDVLSRSLGVPSSSVADIDSAEREFRGGGGTEKFVRGKYLLEFMVFYALEVHKNIPSILPSRTKAPKLNVNVGKRNAMVFVATRCRPPSSLNQFIQNGFISHIRSGPA